MEGLLDLELHDGCARAAFAGRGRVEFLDVRVVREQVRDSPLQHAHAEAVDDADAVDFGESGAESFSCVEWWPMMYPA